MNSTPSLVIGKSQVNGFYGPCHGDIYLIEDKPAMLSSGNYGWTLYRLNEDGSANYVKPVAGWTNIDGQMALVQQINQAWAANN